MVLSVITPCYNEELVVEETYRRLKEVMAKTGMDYELVFINDGSRDNTYPLLLRLSESDKTVKIINFSRNLRPPVRGDGRHQPLHRRLGGHHRRRFAGSP